MRILTSFVTGTALLMTAGLLGCNVDTDPFDTLTSTATLGTTMTQGDGDGDDTSTTATGDGDGDGDTGGECDTYDPMLCMLPGQLLMVMGIEGNFCACPCAANEDCPMGPPNTNGACALSTDGGTPEYCALVCMPGSMDCPAGSTCKDVPMQMGVGLCTYP
jgi:hypothetical protein